jgi:hypothetical protein
LLKVGSTIPNEHISTTKSLSGNERGSYKAPIFDYA